MSEFLTSIDLVMFILGGLLGLAFFDELWLIGQDIGQDIGRYIATFLKR